MSSFDLSKLDELVLRQIVEKFTYRSGVNFYRSCRGAQELVEFVKPVWFTPEQRYHILIGLHDTVDPFVLMDLKMNSWKSLSLALPYNAKLRGAVFFKGEIYIFGGYIKIPRDGLKTAYKLNTNLTWERLPDLSEKRAWSNNVVFHGCIWAIGGWNASDGDLKTVEAYNPASNSWIRKPSLNEPRSEGTAAVVSGKIFVCGGSVPHYRATSLSVDYFDPQLSRWIYCNNLPESLSSLSTVVHGLLLILLGVSVDGIVPTSTVWSMDVEDAEPHWTSNKIPPMQIARFGHAAMLFGGRLVVAGGIIIANYLVGMRRWVEFFDGKTWNTGPNLPRSQHFMGSAAISDEMAEKLLAEYSH